MTAPDVIDASGAVAATLASYRDVLVAYQRKVTGDPAALLNAAQALRADADQLAATAGTLTQAADALGTSWTGDAYNAYHGAAGKLGDDVQAAARALRARADALTAQATALQRARADLDAIIQWYDTASSEQTAASTHASVAAVTLFIRSADQLGRQAVQLAKQVADTLGKQLLGPEERNLVLWEFSADGHGYGTTFGNGVLSTSGGYYAVGPQLSVPPSYERNAKGVTGKGIGLSLLKAGASGTISDGNTTLGATIDANLEGKAGWRNGDLYLSGEAKAAGQLSRTDHGPLSDAWTLNGTADAHANLRAGLHGVSEDIGFGHSIDVSRTYTVEDSGVRFDATGGIGVGFQNGESFTAVYDQGHIKLGIGATVIDGIGVKGSVNLDIDVPKVQSEIASGTSWLFNGAAAAAHSVGEAYDEALRNYSAWSLR